MFTKLSKDQLKQKVEYINSYIGSINAATGSQFDPNANVTSQNVATLSPDLFKDFNVQLKRHIITTRIEQMYGKEAAAEYNRQIEDHEIYVHDESHTCLPYTYSANEVVTIKIDDKIQKIKFCELYLLSQDKEFLEDEDKGVWCKYPNNIEVLDKDGFVKINRLVKKLRHRDMVKVTIDSDKTLTVTDNHPLIVEDDKTKTVEAIDANGLQQFDCELKEWSKIKSVEKVDYEFKFIYDITTESSSLIVNDLWCHNCTSISMYPFLLNGLKDLGGEAKAPKHLDSFCGGFINLVFCLASQFAGACLYKDQELVITNKETNKTESIKAKEFVNKFVLNKSFSNDMGVWEFSDVSNEDLYIEDNKGLTKITKVYRRKYDDLIYKIYFDNGSITYTSKDHKFMTNDNSFVKAENLLTHSEVITKDNKIATVISIITLKNDDEYVYEIETESHVYNCGDIMTHNCATVEFLMCFDYFARKDFGDNYLETNADYIKNKFEQVVYSLNQPAGARSYQCPFWNISIFDKYYFEGMFSEFMFPDDDGTKANWETLSKLQVFFMEWFNKERERALLTFPVVTAATLTENGKPKDKEFNDFLCDQMSKGNSFFNYMSDNVDSLSSCCFAGSQKALIKVDGKEIEDTFYNLSKMNLPKTFLIKHLDEWKEGSLVILPNRQMYKVDLFNGESIIVSDNHLNPTQRGDVETKDLFAEVDSLQTLDGFISIKSIEEYDYSDNIYCFEMKNQNVPYFTLPNGIITHNCRLRNQLTDNTFSFSLGAGGVMAGSMNVITLNFNRLTQNADKEGKTLEEKLRWQLDLLYKYQTATYDYFKSLLQSGMLPAYTANFITMKKQYLTIGINGMLEAAEYKGYTPGNNKDYIKFLQQNLNVIYECNKEARKTYNAMFNTEFVPAENLGVKNYNWDKKDGYVVNSKRNCYNSYFYPVEATDEECNIIDKFVLHGKEVIQYLDGGSALHLNLAEYPTREGYHKLFDLAAKTGCNYWTTNIAVTCCEDCGYITKKTQHHCHKCKSRNVTWATRIIGYLRKITNFSEARQVEESMRHYHKITPNSPTR